jgi:aryl-alcohol dehydrogenase-like predicted oxidoreductase
MAAQRGVSVAQIAIAWLLHQRVVSSVIVGARRLEQLDDNLAAVQVDLTVPELDALDRAGALPREYPGWMMQTQDGRARQLAASGRPNAR